MRLDPVALVLPIGILTLITLMVLPIPTFMLDAIFVLNIAFSIAILMAALNATKPLDFSAFPTVLLFATLLRLALNVASTRIVLVNGHQGSGSAGEVIESFGAFLVGNNFAVGLFVFVILLIINLVVITKGAGRVSEVSARFTLDALPGKQMAIDADIAAGLLTAEEAKLRRSEVSTEADFYGAMDGASKFVKGDAIAALLILGVNLIAGFALGMLSHGLSASEAAERYVTLAVGDALVAQVPALLLSIAAAAIVTRVNDQNDLVGQIGRQFADQRSWLPVAFVLGAISLIPAMPQSAFMPAAAAAFWLYWALRKRMAQRENAEEEPSQVADPSVINLHEVTDQTLVTIELGFGLVKLVEGQQDSPLLTRVTGVRRQISKQFGFVVPQFRIRDALDLEANAYRLVVGGACLAEGEVRAGGLLAIDAGDVRDGHLLQGEATTDPSFGCPAIWIKTSDRDRAIAEGFLTVDPATVIATQLNQVLTTRAEQLLGPEEVRAILDAVSEKAPGLVEAIYPEPMGLAAITRLLRALIMDGFTLGHPHPLLSSIALALQQTQEFDPLVDHVREDLGAKLIERVCPTGKTLPVVTLDAELEGSIIGGMQDPATGQPLIEPGCAKAIGDAVADLVSQHGDQGGIALIVQPPARRALASLLKARAPECLVLSIRELPADQPIEVLSVIGAAEEVPQTALPDNSDSAHSQSDPSSQPQESFA